MKIRNGKYAQRKAISPIIATVLIIAVTLIAAVAIGGFVFGIFGSSSNSAQVAVTQTNFLSATFLTTGTATTTTCAATPANSYITLTNTGTAGTGVVSVAITYAGVTNSFAPTTAGNCPIGAAGSATATESVLLGTAPVLKGANAVDGSPGETYTGTVTLQNGAILIFSGTWN